MKIYEKGTKKISVYKQWRKTSLTLIVVMQMHASEFAVPSGKPQV
jgi:hypothetical protein